MQPPKIASFQPPRRTLMGPGPSDVPQRILDAMARPTIGHLDPAFTDMMEQTKTLLRYAFQTGNKLTFPVSGPGSVGMETCFVNLVEPGDKVIVSGSIGDHGVAILAREAPTDVVTDIPGFADEQRRVAKIRARGHSTESTHETMCMPLAEAGVTVRDVSAFWQAQPFDLELLTVNGRTLGGNCDLCFLKPRGQRLALIKARPEAAVWWIRMESLNLASRPSGARFRNDGPSYADLARFAADQRDLFDAAEEPMACFCGD